MDRNVIGSNNKILFYKKYKWGKFEGNESYGYNKIGKQVGRALAHTSKSLQLDSCSQKEHSDVVFLGKTLQEPGLQFQHTLVNECEGERMDGAKSMWQFIIGRTGKRQNIFLKIIYNFQTVSCYFFHTLWTLRSTQQCRFFRVFLRANSLRRRSSRKRRVRQTGGRDNALKKTMWVYLYFQQSSWRTHEGT